MKRFAPIWGFIIPFIATWQAGDYSKRHGGDKDLIMIFGAIGFWTGVALVALLLAYTYRGYQEKD